MVNIQRPSPRDDDLSRLRVSPQAVNGIESLRSEQVAVLRFTDRSLDFRISDTVKVALSDAITSACETGARGVVLDLARVRMIDSCGISLIIISHNKSSSLNAKFALANVSPFIDKILEIMRLKKHLAIFPSVPEAVESLCD